MALATPDLSHLSSQDYAAVYEPAEDTFLFMDALEQEADNITTIRPLICLEVGSGSGAISAFIAKLLGPDVFYICTDINPNAVSVSLRTSAVNRVCLNPIQMDLVGALLPRLEGSIDIILFNPPYVVTPSTEVGSYGIEASWAGGIKGREVMDRLFPFIPKLLSQRGIFYLVIIKENNQDEISSILSSYGLCSTVILSRRSGPEFLSVVKITRRTIIDDRPCIISCMKSDRL